MHMWMGNLGLGLLLDGHTAEVVDVRCREVLIDPECRAVELFVPLQIEPDGSRGIAESDIK